MFRAVDNRIVADTVGFFLRPKKMSKEKDSKETVAHVGALIAAHEELIKTRESMRQIHLDFLEMKEKNESQVVIWMQEIAQLRKDMNNAAVKVTAFNFEKTRQAVLKISDTMQEKQTAIAKLNEEFKREKSAFDMLWPLLNCHDAKLQQMEAVWRLRLPLMRTINKMANGMQAGDRIWHIGKEGLGVATAYPDTILTVVRDGEILTIVCKNRAIYSWNTLLSAHFKEDGRRSNSRLCMWPLNRAWSQDVNKQVFEAMMDSRIVFLDANSEQGDDEEQEKKAEEEDDEDDDD